MEFKITIILSHIENQSVEDMELNAQNYIKEFIEDDELYIESIEDITSTRKTILEQQELNRKIAKTESKPSDAIIKYVVADVLELLDNEKERVKELTDLVNTQSQLINDITDEVKKYSKSIYANIICNKNQIIKTINMKKRTLGSYLAECEDFVKDLATNKKLCVTDDTISNMIKQNHWLWELTPNNIVDVYYDVIPKQDGDYDTPSFPESVEIQSLKLNGDCVTEILETRFEEIEEEIMNDRNCPL
tara:strand:- start:18065 stop:18805 length:741 start_codon:yes stop_codon:yes gene_type:complete